MGKEDTNGKEKFPEVHHKTPVKWENIIIFFFWKHYFLIDKISSVGKNFGK